LTRRGRSSASSYRSGCGRLKVEPIDTNTTYEGGRVGT
jgi:hypothetical protein